VVARALHHRNRSRVADRKPVAGLAGGEELPPGGAVQHRVSDDEVVMGDVGVCRPPGGANGDLAAAQSLSYIVVRLAFQLEVRAPADERAEALARRAGEAQPHRAQGQPGVAGLLHDGAGHARADGEMVVVDRVAPREGKIAVQIGAQLVEDLSDPATTSPSRRSL
jgi:hypothetical protein